MGGQGSGRHRSRAFTAEPGTKPWERQPVDTTKSWAGFLLYRDLGPRRTLVEAAKALGKPPGYARGMELWSRKGGWVARCEAWDAHTDEVNREAMLEEQRQQSRDMVRRHLAIANDMQRLGHVELRRHLHARGAADGDVDTTKAPTLKISEVRDSLDWGARLERLNRGQPERSEEIVTTDGGKSEHRRSWSEILASAQEHEEEESFDDE